MAKKIAQPKNKAPKYKVGDLDETVESTALQEETMNLISKMLYIKAYRKSSSITLSVNDIVRSLKSKFSDFYISVYFDDSQDLFLIVLKENTLDIRNDFYEFFELVNKHTIQNYKVKFIQPELENKLSVTNFF